ncbi:MAG: bifunctional aspartate kinase/diaminopimelate decarboxylase [Armatimonadetes bacterium]|nr:bifunctional aspartate kinase/diaminopimelate decarboxylase [Armatimonadota bacterium]
MFVVLKYGGTSVSTVERWSTIASVVRERLAEGVEPVVVCSALAGISDRLEQLVQKALLDEHHGLLDEVRNRHLQLAGDLGVPAEVLLREWLELLERLSTGLSLTGEATPRLQAQVMACGELMATRLGAEYLRGQGLEVRWWDARTLLRAVPSGTGAQRAYLSATCSFEADPEQQSRLRGSGAAVHLTQGFIASNAKGETVLLGRGGSDTSAAYLAARLEASRLEIWTDVPGMYTADPRHVPTARMLRLLDYQEAQELATVGARVLHPRCLEPVRQRSIPLEIRCTQEPAMEGTRIVSRAATRGQVKAVSSKSGVILISAEALGMWQEVGFLAHLFDCYQRHGLSIDLVATSETNVTVTLDVKTNALERTTLEPLLADLSQFCKPDTVYPCATVSLVGTRIRSLLHRLGPALELFEEERVHLVSQAASDLNLTFVVDEDQAPKLLSRLHALLFSQPAADEVFGPTWQEQFQQIEPEAEVGGDWWPRKRDQLLSIAAEGTPVYVYDREVLEQCARELLGLESIDRLLYSMKANSNAEVLGVFHELGLSFECVSPGELEWLLRLYPDLGRDRVLYTPNFASREDYEAGFRAGARVTLDNLEPLETWPDVFRGRELFLRMDPGEGGGHHRHVRTAGPLSKFGISPDRLARLRELVKGLDIQVVGLHAHGGSGIKGTQKWASIANFLARIAESFPQVRVLDLGGGLSVPEKAGDAPLDLRELDERLLAFRRVHPQFELWLEPGRYLVARAGVLLARVNQTKIKGDRIFVGVDAGMNCLIRPALYGAYHRIVNLSRWGQPPAVLADVVGPICETGDFLGHDRRLPATVPGDVLLVGNAGAYGRAMSSDYNLRPRGGERLLV